MFSDSRHVVLLATIVATLPAAVRGEDVLVSGRVLAADGKPVKGAEVAVRWTRPERRLEADEALVTSGEGTFEGILRVPDGKPVALMALDDARQRGGVVVLQPQELSAPVEITIHPLVPVQGTFDVSALPAAAPLIRLEVLAQPGDVIVVVSEWKAKQFDLKLPPGRYDLRAVSEGADQVRRPVELVGGGKDVTLEKLELKPSQPAAGVGGQPPPWTVTEARGLNRDVKLADLRGKWVLVEFWGFW